MPLRWSGYTGRLLLHQRMLGMPAGSREDDLLYTKELVRLVDGAENPSGKAFTDQVRAMLCGKFRS